MPYYLDKYSGYTLKTTETKNRSVIVEERLGKMITGSKIL
jgi:hypothetical protein